MAELPCIFVVGCGRNGTSMLTGLFANGKYFMGEKLHRARDSNPKGFFEDATINQINERILAQYTPNNKSINDILYQEDVPKTMQHWLSRLPLNIKITASEIELAHIKSFIDRRPFCYKDPRFCYTLHLWLQFITDAKILCVFRPPEIAVESILKECHSQPYLADFSISVNQAFEVWCLNYSHILERQAKTGSWIFLHYDDILSGKAFPLIESFTGATIDTTFPEAKFKRSTSTLAVPEKANSLYRELCMRAESDLAVLDSSLVSTVCFNTVIDTNIVSSPPVNQLIGMSSTSSLKELLSLDDQLFVHCAYQSLLGRTPDKEGMNYYLNRLLTGVSKIEIIKQIHMSEEGKAFNAKLSGLMASILLYRMTRMPLIGCLIRKLAGLYDNNLIESKIRKNEKQLYSVRDVGEENNHTPAASVTDLANNAAIIICTEPIFEKKSLLLVRSIRHWGGRLRDIPIISISPRNQTISPEIRKEFSNSNVVHIELPLNVVYNEYGLANKPIVCNYVESNFNYDLLIFMDSDKVVFNEPTALMIPNEIDAAMRSVDNKNIGICDFNDVESDYWKKIYHVSGKLPIRHCVTTVGNQDILEYFNSGLFVTRSSRRLFSRWCHYFMIAMNNKIQPSGGLFFLEQSVFSATITAHVDNLSILPKSYNYPIILHNDISNENKIYSFDEMISIHYHQMFDADWKAALDNLCDLDLSSLRYKWLVDNLQDLGFGEEHIDEQQQFINKGIRQPDNHDLNTFHWHAPGDAATPLIVTGFWAPLPRRQPDVLLRTTGLSSKLIDSLAIPEISFITTCMGRLDFLRQSLPTWIDQPNCEVVVVDFSCPQRCGEWVEHTYPEVKVVRVNGESFFNLSKARNAGAVVATGRYLCMIDADVLLATDFSAKVIPLLSANCILRAGPGASTDLVGTVLIPQCAYNEVGGYDEVIVGWGGEDVDIYLRLQRSGLCQMTFPNGLLTAIFHDDDLRTQNAAIQNRILGWNVNRLYIECKMSLWRMLGELPDIETRQTLYDLVRRAVLEGSGQKEVRVELSLGAIPRVTFANMEYRVVLVLKDPANG